MNKKKKILIATGGTGGHVFPAYSLANYLIKNDYHVKLTTDKRGFNYIKDFDHMNTNHGNEMQEIEKDVYNNYRNRWSKN